MHLSIAVPIANFARIEKIEVIGEYRARTDWPFRGLTFRYGPVAGDQDVDANQPRQAAPADGVVKEVSSAREC